MKRSEMLRDIKILIEDGLKHDHSPEDTARFILDYQEQNGMAPPFYDNIQSNVVIPSRSWEKEVDE